MLREFVCVLILWWCVGLCRRRIKLHTERALLRIPDGIRRFSTLRTLIRNGHSIRVCRVCVQFLRAVQRIFSHHRASNLPNIKQMQRAHPHSIHTLAPPEHTVWNPLYETYTHTHIYLSDYFYIYRDVLCRITTISHCRPPPRINSSRESEMFGIRRVHSE